MTLARRMPLSSMEHTPSSDLSCSRTLCYRIATELRGEELHWHVLAACDILQGTRVLLIEGVESGSPTRHSIQFGQFTHIAPPTGLLEGADTSPTQAGHFGWRYLDHSCDPNCVFEGRALIACRPIREGEKICFDYEVTEHTLSAPFRCACGACDGRMIRGHAHRAATPARAMGA